jgi:multisubunit Na+/H+ antiporter MnhE subunit
VALWLLAWGEASRANFVSGVFVGAALLVAFPPVRQAASPLRLRPVAVTRLVAHLVTDLVVSNVLVAREILGRPARVRTGIIVYPVRHPSEEVQSLVANLIALSPGTMTVEATREPAEIHIHFLLLRDEDAARRSVARLEELVSALGRVATSSPALPPEGDR